MNVNILKDKFFCYVDKMSTEMAWFDKPVEGAGIDCLLKGENYKKSETQHMYPIKLQNEKKSVYITEKDYQQLIDENVIEEKEE